MSAGPTWQERYNEYLNSPSWKARRDYMYDVADGECELCSSRDELTVHHLHYGTVGHEEPPDLVVLCWPCHQEVQNVFRFDPRYIRLKEIAARHPETFAAILEADRFRGSYL